jgi:hypothetical protein
MFLTLLLPIVLPYGDPVTFFHPRAHYERKVEFFKWVDSINNHNYDVPLLMSEEKNETNNPQGHLPVIY